MTVDRRNSDPFSFQDGTPVRQDLDTRDANPGYPLPGSRHRRMPSDGACSGDDYEPPRL